MIKKMLKYSIDKKLGHIPSALSMLGYLEYLWKNHLDKDWNIVIGKPYGAQAYYIIWKEIFKLDINNLSYGVKHSEIDFVDYGEETLGNALGVASGLSLGNNKKTWCNISDASLQMGPTLEALQFIGKNQQDILLTIDFNNMQLTGKNTQNIWDVYSMFFDFKWNVLIINATEGDYSGVSKFLSKKGPKAIIFKTLKGEGVKEMEVDPITWHYKILNSIDDITLSEK